MNPDNGFQLALNWQAAADDDDSGNLPRLTCYAIFHRFHWTLLALWPMVTDKRC